MSIEHIRHVGMVPDALKIAIRKKQAVHDEAGRVVGERAAENYRPAHAWVIKKDDGGLLRFHHDQTERLMKQLRPAEADEDQGKEVATLYKIDPSAERWNVRASRRLRAAAMARIGAI